MENRTTLLGGGAATRSGAPATELEAQMDSVELTSSSGEGRRRKRMNDSCINNMKILSNNLNHNSDIIQNSILIDYIPRIEI